MASRGNLICWQCNKWTPAGQCINCGALVSDPEKAFLEEENEPEPRILEIQRRDKESIKINFDYVIEIVRQNFSIKKMVIASQPQFVVEHPKEELDEKFDHLLLLSEELTRGFKPKIERYKSSSDLVISYIYHEPPGPSEYRTVFLLGIFSMISIFMAAMFNFSQLNQALDISLEGLTIFSVTINIDAIINSLMFTSTLIFLLLVKDITQIRSLIKNFQNKITPFYIPAPPIFELGTLGSIHKQDHIHKTREEMYSSTIYGPIIAWFASIILIMLTLPLATYNPVAAKQYAGHSVVANGTFEPAIFYLVANLANSIGLTSLDLSSPLTQQYIFHPVTLAAMAGFYLTSFSLLPAAHFNGGFIIRSTLGRRAHWILTYIMIFALLSIHWLLASLVFFIHEILKSPELLNEESSPPKYYKYILVPYFIIILISFPISFDFITLY